MAGRFTPRATSSATSTAMSLVTSTIPSILDNLDSTDEVIDDTDLRIAYSGTWIQKLDEGGVPSKTSHNTLVSGSSLVVTFSGTGIDLLGIVHIGGGTVIELTFFIDGGGAQQTSVPLTTITTADQTFFSVRGLQNQQHVLKLVVGDGAGSRLFTIDCFVVTKDSSGGSTSLPASASGSALTSGTASTITTTSLSVSSPSSPSSTATTTTPAQSRSSSTRPLDLDVSSTSSLSGSAGSSVESSPVDPHTPDQLSTSSGHHMSAGQVAGTVIGTLLGFALLVAFFLALLRWRAIRKRRMRKLDTIPSPLFTNHSENGGGALFRNEKTHVDLEELSPPEYEEYSGSPSIHEDGYPGIPFHRSV